MATKNTNSITSTTTTNVNKKTITRVDNNPPVRVEVDKHGNMHVVTKAIRVAAPAQTILPVRGQVSIYVLERNEYERIIDLIAKYDEALDKLSKVESFINTARKVNLRYSIRKRANKPLYFEKLGQSSQNKNLTKLLRTQSRVL